MFYQCPYCDMKISSRLKPCPYCGAASAHFKEVKEEKDYFDKVDGRLIDTRGNTEIQPPTSTYIEPPTRTSGVDYTVPVRQLFLLFFAVIAVGMKGYGFFIAIVILIVTMKKSSPLRKGAGKWARLIAVGVLLVYIILGIIGLTLYTAYQM